MTCERKALIIAADAPTGLGTARALCAEDIEIIGMCVDPTAPCAHSRVWDRLVLVDSYEPEVVLERLISLGKTLRGETVLFSDQDPITELVSEQRALVQPYYRFVLPEASAVKTLLDKVVFQEWAETEGFLVPRTRFARSPEEIRAALNELRFPVVLKPPVRDEGWNATFGSLKVLWLGCAEDLDVIAPDPFSVARELLAQEFIPGTDRDIYFCLSYFDRSGRERAYYCGRKLLQWPVDCGCTAVGLGIEDEKVHRITESLFKRLNFCGLGSVEFKKSPVDQRYYIMEPTAGRNDLQSPIATAGGVNLTRLAFYDALEVLNEVDGGLSEPAMWICEPNFLKSFWQSPGKLRRAFLANLVKERPRLSFAYFHRRDLAPALHYIAGKSAGRAGRH